MGNISGKKTLETEELKIPLFIIGNLNWLSVGAYVICLGFRIYVHALKSVPN